MSTNPSAKAVVSPEAPVYYTESGKTKTSISTVEGQEFWIETADPNFCEAVRTALNDPETIYVFALGDTDVLVARRDVIQLERYYRDDLLPK